MGSSCTTVSKADWPDEKDWPKEGWKHALNYLSFSPGKEFAWTEGGHVWSGIVVETAACSVKVRDILPCVLEEPAQTPKRLEAFQPVDECLGFPEAKPCEEGEPMHVPAIVDPKPPSSESEARAAFVAKIKDENFYTSGSKQSLKSHWRGAAIGFADESVQGRWFDFLAGWKARDA